MVAVRTVANTCIVLAACTAEPYVVPETDEVAVSVVLSVPPAGEELPLHALLIVANSPIRSTYLRADRFEMRRTRDGALFDWQHVPRNDMLPRAPTPQDGNYRLPNGTSGRLGRRDLTANEQYSLEIETRGRTIRGTARIPGPVALAIRPMSGGREELVWRPVTGAAGYFYDTDEFYVVREFTRDTVVALAPHDHRTGTRPLRVTAYDPQLYEYLTDSRVGQAGIRGALGVFGASASATIRRAP
jgi:hypothetical protein